MGSTYNIYIYINIYININININNTKQHPPGEGAHAADQLLPVAGRQPRDPLKKVRAHAFEIARAVLLFDACVCACENG